MNAQEKRSSRPAQSGGHSRGYQSRRRRQPKPIIYRARRFFKRYRRAILLAAVVIVAVFALFRSISPGKAPDTTEAADSTLPPQETTAPGTEPPTYYFNNGDGTPVSWQELTDAWAREAGFEKRYELTDAERWEIASVITAEAEGEPLAGKVAVAQCVLQTCEDEGIRPSEVFAKYSYAKRRPDPTWEALEAVQAVFDFGEVATSEPIKYFYAPAIASGSWHETQVYVLTINGHKFFKEAAD